MYFVLIFGEIACYRIPITPGLPVSLNQSYIRAISKPHTFNILNHITRTRNIAQSHGLSTGALSFYKAQVSKPKGECHQKFEDHPIILFIEFNRYADGYDT